MMHEQANLNTTTRELQQLCDMSGHLKKRIAEMVSNLQKELSKIGSTLGSDGSEIKITIDAAKLEEEFTTLEFTCLYIYRMKSEVLNFTQRLHEIANKEQEQLRVVYQKQVAVLMDEIAKQQALIKESKFELKTHSRPTAAPVRIRKSQVERIRKVDKAEELMSADVLNFKRSFSTTDPDLNTASHPLPAQ